MLEPLQIVFENEPVRDYGGGRKEVVTDLLGDCEDQMDYCLMGYKDAKYRVPGDESTTIEAYAKKLQAFGAIAG